MAAVQKGNRWYPEYVSIGYRKIKLDPAKTPMQNLWEVIRVSCSIWLAKYRVYAYSREAIDELEQEFQMRTFLRLRDHVWRGTYRRDLSLYLNVRSAAWGVCSNVIKLWKDTNIIEPSLTLDIDEPIASPSNRPGSNALTLGDTFASHLVPKLRTTYDGILQTSYRRGKKHSLDEVERGSKEYHQVWRAITEEQYDYYLQSCYEYGIDPLDHDAFIAQNFPAPGMTKREKALKKAKEKWTASMQKKKEQG